MIRIGGSRARTGCPICKARRIKCDEERPSCRRCIRSGRQCHYDALETRKRRPVVGVRFIYYAEPERALSSLIPSDDRRALSYLVHAAAQDISGIVGADLWTRSMPMLAEHEMAVRNGLVALSLFHEAYIKGESLSIENRPLVYAWRKYSSFVAQSRALSVHHTENLTASAIMTCLILNAIESLLGHPGTATGFLQHGINLMRGQVSMDRAAGPVWVSDRDEESLYHFYANLASQDTTYYEDLGINCGQSAMYNFSPDGKGFASPAEALSFIASLLHDLRRLKKQTTTSNIDDVGNDPKLARTVANLRQKHNFWISAYEKMKGRRGGADLLPDQIKSDLILQMNSCLCEVLIGTSIPAEPPKVDPWFGNFQLIVEDCGRFLDIERTKIRRTPGSGQRPSFSLPIGILPPLFFAAARCSDQTVRDRAINMLRYAHRRESVWDSALLADAAELAAADHSERPCVRHDTPQTISSDDSERVENGREPLVYGEELDVKTTLSAGWLAWDAA